MGIYGGEEWVVEGAAVPSGAAVSFYVTNNSGQTICYLYISPVTDDTWNDDWLGDSVLDNGNGMEFFVTPGEYDLLASDCDGEAIEVVWGATITGDEEWVVEGQ